jgi:hypothetical protein
MIGHPPSNEAELEEQISAIAVGCGIVLNDGYAGFAPEAASTALYSIAEERGYADCVWPWRRLMTECVNYLAIQSLAFEMALRRDEPTPNDFIRAAWSLSTKATSEARCVLHLCDHGFPGQAAIVARSCIETIEALAAFLLDPESTSAFVASKTPDEANRTWFELIRKKARRAIDDAFAEIVELDERTKDWRQHNLRLHGALTHPSYMAPMLNLFLDWEDGREGHPTLPARTMNCVQVWQAIVAACFEYASLVLLRVAGPVDAVSAEPPMAYENVGFFEEAWLDSYAGRGHKFFQKLWIFFVERQYSPPFSTWRGEQAANIRAVS